VPAGATEAAVEAALAAQAEAGLEPLTDGGLRPPDADPVAAWLDTAARARGSGRAVKAVLPGPFSGAFGDREAAVARARSLRTTIAGLADTGCPLVEVHEPGLAQVGADAARRAAFVAASMTLLDGLGDLHVSLAVTGGNADGAGIETLLGAPFASLALDLIEGPDNWRLAARWPGERGLVCGALSGAPDSDDGPELLLFAARYAASLGGRGPTRVGLATAGSLAHLPWTVAVAKLRRLGEGARIAGLPPGPELAASLDPRAIDTRSAAFGRYVRRRPQRPAG
jgi:methionine synthase II (cobalamin-independent)